ncbi:MAG: ribosome biogenesis GTPase Der [Spirochaetota bacterium]
MNASNYTITNPNIPSVAIIGRPNVGKSTLFNRLIGQRKAITHAEPGVTRDPIFAQWQLADRPVELIDTGGVKLDQEGLDGLVTDKSYQVLSEADVIVLLMDVTEVTPEDETLVEALRAHSKKIVLAVNKIDTPKRDDLLWDYYRYGFEHVVGLSSAHGLGIEELEEQLIEMIDFEFYDAKEQQDFEQQPVKIAILGKPNTGKSTLANQLLGHEASIVSDIPGTTRDVIAGSFSHKGTEYIVLDTAGIRRKSKVYDDVEYYSVNRAIATTEEADIIFLMVDASEGLVEQDKKIANLIVRRGKGVVLVLNKWDLVKEVPNQMQAIKDRTRFQFPILAFAPLVPISAHTGEGISKLLSTGWGVWKQLNTRVGTARLNTALGKWVQAYEPPRGKLGHFKVYYGTQTSTAPVRFLFFVNRSHKFPQGYIQYLTNCIRRDLGFSSVPLEVDIRERSRT